MNILHLEDSPVDARLIEMALNKELPACRLIWVDNKRAFKTTLSNTKIDLVLCDYALPDFDGIAALKYIQQQQLDMPFILISGAIGEEKAIEIFKAGATDFILKDNLPRLKPSIQRALRERAEIQKRKATERALQASNEELMQFVHIASHDLKSPLIAIERLSSWIEEDCCDKLPKESKEHFKLLRQRIKRMFHLIDGISQYSQAGRVQIHPERVDTKVLIDEIIEMIHFHEAYTITYDEELPTLFTAKAFLNLVFCNLIKNSIEHHHKKSGRIHVTCQDSGDYYKFCVIDDGPGIPSKYRHKVFEMFQTLKPRDELDTAGMGLSIVKKIVESQGGEITLNSKQGKGTTICFTWRKK